MTTLLVIVGYLCLLLGLGFFSSRLFRGTSKDYFVASHSIGQFLLLMSVFGTTMTAFRWSGPLENPSNAASELTGLWHQ